MTISKRKVILLDIDFVIFDVEKYRQSLYRALAKKAQFSDEERFLKTATETYREIRKTGYPDMALVVETLTKKLSLQVASNDLFPILKDEKLVLQALYPETKAVIEELAQRPDAIVGIFSGGRMESQRLKISTMKHLFHNDHIYIFESNKQEQLEKVLAQYTAQQIFFVDDLLEILYQAKKINTSLITIWMKRGLYAEKHVGIPGFSPDYTVTALQELLTIVRD